MGGESYESYEFFFLNEKRWLVIGWWILQGGIIYLLLIQEDYGFCWRLWDPMQEPMCQWIRSAAARQGWHFVGTEAENLGAQMATKDCATLKGAQNWAAETVDDAEDDLSLGCQFGRKKSDNLVTVFTKAGIFQLEFPLL